MVTSAIVSKLPGAIWVKIEEFSIFKSSNFKIPSNFMSEGTILVEINSSLNLSPAGRNRCK